MTSELFAASVKKCRKRELSVTDLLTAVETLAKHKEAGLVIELYKIWIQHNATDPLLYAIYFNFGIVLSDAGDLSGAKEAFSAGIALNPGFMPTYINLGNVLEKMGATDQAITQWSKAADYLGAINGEAIGHKTTAMKQIGRVFETAKLEASAEEVLKRSLDINPRQRDVTQHWIALRQSQCKWPLFAPETSVTAEEILQSISPLSLAVYSDDPIFQLSSAHHYNKRDVSIPATAFHTHAKPARNRTKLRIGYVSSDLREHAVGFLMSEVFPLHDRKAVEVFAYYCGVPSNDTTHARFKASSDHWCDINGHTDGEAAQRIKSDEIDILVDLNGYTKDARLKLFAMRPAPIIVNWLGFPGTMGSAYHNYIIADPFTIPVGDEVYFSEKVMRLPCYQPNDRQRNISSARPARTEAGLPQDAFVYCCFNGTQKITPAAFKDWMGILRAAENSVLWLLTGTAETNARLRDAAEAHGIKRERIVFADRKPNPEHLARYPLADVFLDTSPYGAHTTASDAMWMGIPVITVPGKSFASRVCGSLVTAAGLSELVSPTKEAYIAKAIELYNDRGKLELLKKRLADGRDKCVLFDTPGLVRSLEELYQQMWSDYVEGRLHNPDLSNLEILHEAGCEVNVESRRPPLGCDTRAIYRQKLAERHAYTALRYDPRLAETERPEARSKPAAPAPRRETAEVQHRQPASTRASGELELQC